MHSLHPVRSMPDDWNAQILENQDIGKPTSKVFGGKTFKVLKKGQPDGEELLSFNNNYII